ncbi:MAG: MCE family protein [Deltaproteobacteria bacterium]|nr:MCE family protein [Deltaproteobacteria bacterium]
MSNFTTEAKVGVFVLVGLILLAYMSFRVGGFQWGRAEGYNVYALFDSASGLKKDVSVEIAGIQIGRVDHISLQDNQARIDLSINAGVPLAIDCQALIRTKGVLGDKFIEIAPGSRDVPLLNNGDRIARTVTPTDIDQIIGKVGQISEDIKKVTNSLGDVLGSEQGASQLKSMLANFSEMSQNLAKLTRDNSEQLRQMIENFTVFSADLRSMSNTNKNNINAILASFAQTSQKLNQTVTSLQAISDRVNRGEGTIGKLINDDTTVKSLNSTLSSLKDISNKINAGQGTLGKLVNDATTGEKIDEALTGINNYLAKNDAFKVYVDYRGDYLTRHGDFKSTLNIRLQPSQDKFYILGITNDVYGNYTKKDITATTNNISNTSTEETWETPSLKFNAQIARRYYDFVVRGGLIESAGGIGLDYYMLDDALKMTLEGFSGEIKRKPHLRAYASYTFWKHFYVALGYDDFISDQGRSSPFVGVGLSFNDDDLKYLLTSAPIPKK